MDLATAIEKYWSHVVAACALVGGAVRWWVSARSKRRAETVAALAAQHAAKLDLTKIAQEAAHDVVELLRAEVARLSAELDDVRAAMREMQREHLSMMAGKDAKIALLEGEIRQRDAIIEACRRQLAAHGLPLPALSAHYEVSGSPPALRGAVEAVP